MLICRSARDFVTGGKPDEVFTKDGTPAFRLLDDDVCSALSFGGGVAGALTFALSPVEWSQSTIVEIYSLNALFLMGVFLLTYRWMRRPTDRMLWFSAFVFGLGLTNYQVLLFAIVPLALVIALRNLPLFRDFFLYLIPIALTYQILQIGQLVRASREMQADAINKHLPLVDGYAPSTTLIVLALVVLVVSVAWAAASKRGEKTRKVVAFGGGGAAALLFLTSLVFKSKTAWTGLSAEVAPLVEPSRYAFIAAAVAGSVVAAVLAAMKLSDEDEKETPFIERLTSQFGKELVISLILAVVAVVAATMVPAAGDGGYMGAKYPWGKSTLVFWMLILVLLAISACTKRGLVQHRFDRML